MVLTYQIILIRYNLQGMFKPWLEKNRSYVPKWFRSSQIIDPLFGRYCNTMFNLLNAIASYY